MADRQSIPVSLPAELVRQLDELVEQDVFGSRSAAIRYGARLVVREHKEGMTASRGPGGDDAGDESQEPVRDVNFDVRPDDDLGGL